MLLRLLSAALLALGLSSAASAQAARTVAACSTQADRLGDAAPLTKLANGDLCVVTGTGAGSGATGSVTSAGTNGTQAQAVQGINGGVPVATTSATADAATNTYAVTATGPMPGVPLRDYAAVLAHVLTGTLTAQVEVSVNSTNGTDGDWDAVIQGYHPEVPAGGLAATVSNTVRRRIYNTAGGVWARINVTAFTAAGSIALVRRTEPYAERSVFVAGGSTGLAAGTNVIGSTTLRSAGTNRSATVGTTAVALWPSDTARQGGWVKNDTATALWCNFDGTATATAGGGNFQVAANGGAYTTEPGFVSTNALSCISTASIAITSRTH